MNISQYGQLSIDSLQHKVIDLFICSSGYESRARHIFDKMKGAAIKQKALFAFNDKTDHPSRKDNDRYFRGHDFLCIDCDGDSEKEVARFLSGFLTKNTDKKEVTIFIDYSTMTRIWYASILSFFSTTDSALHTVHLYFGYSMAKYTQQAYAPTYNIHIGPIKGFTHISVPQRPTALIIGLGFDNNRAIGLDEYFDGETFLFHSNDSTKNEYSAEVVKNNHELMAGIKKENIYPFSIANLDYTFDLLLSLCKDLSKDYRVVIAPCGPKPFSLLSLLTFVLLEEVDVWRISSGKESVALDKEANGEVLVFGVDFGS